MKPTFEHILSLLENGPGKLVADFMDTPELTKVTLLSRTCRKWGIRYFQSMISKELDNYTNPDALQFIKYFREHEKNLKQITGRFPGWERPCVPVDWLRTRLTISMVSLFTHEQEMKKIGAMQRVHELAKDIAGSRQVSWDDAAYSDNGICAGVLFFVCLVGGFWTITLENWHGESIDLFRAGFLVVLALALIFAVCMITNRRNANGEIATIKQQASAYLERGSFFARIKDMQEDILSPTLKLS